MPTPRKKPEDHLPKGRPPYKRDEVTAQMVALFIGTGVKIEAVSHRFKISDDTLRKYYPDEVRMGKELNEMFWIGSLAAAARKGSVDAIKFALSRKFGWVEKQHFVIDDAAEDGIIFDDDRQPATDDEDPNGNHGSGSPEGSAAPKA